MIRNRNGRKPVFHRGGAAAVEDGMLRRMALRILMIAGAAVAATSSPAAAGGHGHGHGHSHFAFGLNLSVPCCRPYYAPTYYYPPPPVYYYPPPVAYAPPPVYYLPAPAPTVGNCRDYRGDATIDGQGTPFYGRACLGRDGRWHIVSQN
jgi:hypothetical protein